MDESESEHEVWEEPSVQVTRRWYGNVNFFLGACVGFFIGSLFTWVILAATK